MLKILETDLELSQFSFQECQFDLQECQSSLQECQFSLQECQFSFQEIPKRNFEVSKLLDPDLPIQFGIPFV